ncbi:C-type lectin domain family 6 member A-like [Armigeres subalbatus]|uniref:C-type lectin domain family 6 member A-like n=1 Tax=Armigeres subalbatus TaxID=124917 RepID=UPI002ED5FAE7
MQKIYICCLLIAYLHMSLSAEPKYHVATYASNWFESAEYCHRMGRRLAIVDSERKHSAVVAAAKKTQLWSSGNFGVWLGATDLARRNNFVWHSTGERVEFAKWRFAEPSGGNEHCLVLQYWPWLGFFWSWNDASCDKKLYAICEADPTVECIQAL